jgi:putative nucleotidyltransferase with HDIG domain
VPSGGVTVVIRRELSTGGTGGVASVGFWELDGESRTRCDPEVGVPFEIDAARCLAATLLRHGSEPWLHAQATARRAEQISAVVGPVDRDVLVCAAWLHDVGLTPDAVPRTGFHPVDGAHLLQDAGWPPRVVALVAHHCEARITAAALGLAAELLPFRREDGPLPDALVYADLAAAPAGRRISLRDRLDDLDRRHADDPPALREAWQRRRQALVAAVARTEQRLAGVHRQRVKAAV